MLALKASQNGLAPSRHSHEAISPSRQLDRDTQQLQLLALLVDEGSSIDGSHFARDARPIPTLDAPFTPGSGDRRAFM